MSNEVILYTERDTLTFSEMLMSADPQYAGNAIACYRAVFRSGHMKDSDVIVEAGKLLENERVQEMIVAIQEERSTQLTAMVKAFSTANLIHIAQEMSTAEFVDRKGRPQSPAACRAVAVNAIKALTALHPSVAKKIDEDEQEGSATVIFNVNPQKSSETKIDNNEN